MALLSWGVGGICLKGVCINVDKDVVRVVRNFVPSPPQGRRVATYVDQTETSRSDDAALCEDENAPVFVSGRKVSEAGLHRRT